MRKINIMGIRSKVIMNRQGTDYLVMEPITEEQEKELDLRQEINGEVHFITDKGVYIRAKDIFLYGEVNINNVADLNLIKSSDIIIQEVNMAANVPSNFDYKTGFVYSNRDGIFKTHDTWDKELWFKFNHLLLGKPKRIIIYRIFKNYVERNRSTRGNIVYSEL